ncbi:MAG: hypothetical protein KME21_06310 [Desmonostoc vinosum HA7617-LM4]|nr:hypothetical protein [Desmonostoc vinosum HA7617-LM4]
MTLVLVLTLASCGEKAGSQEVSYGQGESTSQVSQVSKQFSEVPPPTVIQELRPSLEVYQPQVAIITPQPDEVLQDDKVTVSLQVKDLPIFIDPKLELGPHLNVILDNQPYIPVYDLNQPLVLSDLTPGTHTLRVFASRPWHESFKNEGAYAQATFHVFTKTDDNNPDPSLPLLTYSHPQGNYGAEPILLDFYLTNAPLHLVAQENADDKISDWRIRCTINGESFIFDRWQAVYLKGFQRGKNWMKLEFLDNQGNPVKNDFNTTVRLINYQPKGKDTLAKIVRGELKANQVRGIVGQSYTVKPSVIQPTPTPSVEITPEPEVEEKQPTPETEVPEVPQIQPTETPQLEVTPQPQATELPKKETPEPEKPRFGGFFNRRSRPSVQPSPSLPPTLPEVIESPIPQLTPPLPEITPTPQKSELPEKQVIEQPEITPAPQKSELPEIQIIQPEKKKFGKFFQRQPSPSLSPTPTEVIEPPVPQSTTPSVEITPEPKPEVTNKQETGSKEQGETVEITPEAKPEVSKAPESTPIPEKPKFWGFFQRRPRPTPELSPVVSPTLPEIIESPAPPELENTAQPQQQKPVIVK